MFLIKRSVSVNVTVTDNKAFLGVKFFSKYSEQDSSETVVSQLYVGLHFHSAEIASRRAHAFSVAPFLSPH